MVVTGDNHYYLYQNPEVSGTYKNINDYKDYLLIEEDLEKIRNNEAIRLKVIERGLHKSKDEKNFDPDLWFEGKYIIPYDKGGESDTESGWLPNYYVLTNYYIDWSTEAVKRLKTLTTNQRNKFDNKTGGNNKLCSRFQNKEYYFKNGITASRVGQYSPTHRLASDTIFDSGCSNIYCDFFNRNHLLGILNSKICKYFFKLVINHSVNSQVDDTKEIPFCLEIKDIKSLLKLVDEIIQKQGLNSYYDYFSKEQIEIDKIIYEIYGLNEKDINEIETWYKRRYPKFKMNEDNKFNLKEIL